METKPIYLSKTLWVNLIVAIAAFFPSVHALIQASPEGFALLVAGINGALRLISKGKLVLWG